MSFVKHQSRIREKQKSSSRTSVIYMGTLDEMLNLQELNEPGTVNEEIGKVSSSRVYQTAASLWECELVSELVQGDAVTGPDTSYGAKSAQLRGTLLSLPLESHPKYLTNWNHYLFCAPESKKTVPSWWSTAKGTIITGKDAESYAWGKQLGDAPVTNNKPWSVICDLQMPGVESRDVSTYSVTISSRYSTFSAAASAVANKLNTVTTDIGIRTGISGGNWKCDDASIQWHEKYWLVTWTYTRSGDRAGWNSTLYGS